MRRLRRREAQRRQPTRRVVNEHDQSASWATVVQPCVRTAVDLDQLAEPRAPRAQRMHALRAPLLRTPQKMGDLDLTDGLLGNPNPLVLRQLLGRKRRAEPGVFAAEQR